ncbi:MAG TPA: alpha/beta hydrolase [Acidimicrobiales bacterium]|nr:alpha/beta hydrolase [Acidimicrobiales bacterium]
MPIDPQVQEVLDLLSSMSFPGLSAFPVDQARQAMDAMRANRPEPPAVARVDDRTIPGPAGDVPVRIYTPAGAVDGELLPLIVFFHGGGWVIGSIDTHETTARELANGTGDVVVSVEYRLAPEHRFPAAVDDAWAATQWVAAHAGEIGGDGSRLAVAGDSAGGNLAAVIAIHARDTGLPLRFQLLVYPAVDASMASASIAENASGYFLTEADMDWFYGHYTAVDQRHERPADWRLSPILANDLTGVAPALVLTAEYDPLRDEGEAYAEQLRAAGVEASVTRYDGMIHGFFGMTATVDRARDAMQEATAALSKALSA